MIYLSGEVNTEMYLDLAKRLDKRPNKINVSLCSEGGDLGAGLAIYDRLKAVPDCTITATGECSSMATVILQAAKLRRATPNCQFLFHLSYAERPEGKEDETPTPQEMLGKVHMDQIMFEIYHTKIPVAGVREALRRKLFAVDVAIKLGVIDEVYLGHK